MSEGEPDKPATSPTATGGIAKYCKRCHYPLKGLEFTGLCPECGRTYDLSQPLTFTYDAKPKPIWRRLLPGPLRCVPLLGMLGVGHLMFANASCAVFIIYPVWLAATCYLILDLLFRLLNLPPGFTGAFVGGIIGMALGAAILSLYGGGSNVWFSVISFVFGYIGGICLVQMEIANMRQT